MFAYRFTALLPILALAMTSEGAPAAASADVQKSNAIDAQALNAQFAALQATDSCQEGQQACVEQQFAQCVSEKWVLQECSGSNVVCVALPLVNGPGTSITCDTTQDAVARIQAAGADASLTGNGSAGSTNSTISTPTLSPSAVLPTVASTTSDAVASSTAAAPAATTTDGSGDDSDNGSDMDCGTTDDGDSPTSASSISPQASPTASSSPYKRGADWRARRLVIRQTITSSTATSSLAAAMSGTSTDADADVLPTAIISTAGQGGATVTIVSVVFATTTVTVDGPSSTAFGSAASTFPAFSSPTAVSSAVASFPATAEIPSSSVASGFPTSGASAASTIDSDSSFAPLSTNLPGSFSNGSAFATDSFASSVASASASGFFPTTATATGTTSFSDILPTSTTSSTSIFSTSISITSTSIAPSIITPAPTTESIDNNLPTDASDIAAQLTATI